MIYHSPSHTFSSQSNASFDAHEIDFPSLKMNVAEIVLNDRYPQKGYTLNTESEMIVRILEGAVTFECEGEKVFLEKGSSVLVEINKHYRWTPNGTVTLYIVSNPPWTPKQARQVDIVSS